MTCKSRWRPSRSYFLWGEKRPNGPVKEISRAGPGFWGGVGYLRQVYSFKMKVVRTIVGGGAFLVLFNVVLVLLAVFLEKDRDYSVAMKIFEGEVILFSVVGALLILLVLLKAVEWGFSKEKEKE